MRLSIMWGSPNTCGHILWSSNQTPKKLLPDDAPANRKGCSNGVPSTSTSTQSHSWNVQKLCIQLIQEVEWAFLHWSIQHLLQEESGRI